MKFFLLGYMGSGKSYIGKELAKAKNLKFVDLDVEIEEREEFSIATLFKKRGEIYFRKLERKILEELIDSEKSMVISLGGGTPCYGDNLDLIKNDLGSTTVYLKLKVETLTNRLDKEKEQRPLISHLKEKEKLEEFIRKHLFERGFYYNQSQHIISCDNKSKEDIVTEIMDKLG